MNLEFSNNLCNTTCPTFLAAHTAVLVSVFPHKRFTICPVGLQTVYLHQKVRPAGQLPPTSEGFGLQTRAFFCPFVSNPGNKLIINPGRTLGKPRENLGKSPEKTRENPGKLGKTPEKPRENPGKTPGKTPRKSLENP